MRRTALTVHTLLHYDQIGLLTPSGRSHLTPVVGMAQGNNATEPPACRDSAVGEDDQP
jgi:hypothetical protein